VKRSQKRGLTKQEASREILIDSVGWSGVCGPEVG
jgi:hypothetical protein